MTKAGKLAGTVSVLLAAALAGCQMGPAGGPMRPPMASPPPQIQQTGVEGTWIDQAGAGISNFTAGRFQTVAADTGQRLSEGTYTLRDQYMAEITGTSIIRQTAVAFNCALVSPIQLNCTAADGQQFVMTRYSGPMPMPASQPVAGGPGSVGGAGGPGRPPPRSF